MSSSLSSLHTATENISLSSLPPLPPSMDSLSLRDITHDNEPHDTTLPPVDRGRGAWSFLIGAFLVEGIVWSFPNSYGVFLSSYSSDPVLNSQPHSSTLLPLAGNLASGIMYCSSPFIYAVTARYPSCSKPLLWAGLVLCFASLVGSSYTDNVALLVFLQGALYGIGGSVLYALNFSFMSEWFVVRRGLANGVIFSGSAIGGLLVPLIIPHLMTKYGRSATLRICAFSLLLLIPCLPFVKGRGRMRIISHNNRTGRLRASAIMHPWFALTMVINTLQGLAYFVPLLWIPSFASSLDVNPSNASLSLALLNGTAVFSRILMGYLSDHFSPWLLATFSMILTSLATFLIWGVAGFSLGALVAFGAIYGGLASGWTSLWTAFLKPVTHGEPALSTHLFGFLMLSRGLGNVLSSPISSSLSRLSAAFWRDVSTHTGFAVDDGKYSNIILYVGTCFAAGAVLGLVGWLMEKKKGGRSGRRN